MNNIQKYLPACLLVVLALLVGMFGATSSLYAQNAFGALVGTVTDSSGAVVPGATVSLTNLGTSEKKVTQSDASGNYRFMSLQPTQYKVEYEKTSYKRVVQSPITIQVDATARLDVSLQVGAASETIEVTTQAPLLQTESGTLGSQVEGKTVEQMPLNGRNVTNLIALVPGVVPQGASMGNTTMNQTGTHTNNAGWGNFQIGGAIGGQGSMYMDGAPLNTLFAHDIALIPTQDAIQEFKVGTNSVSAEFGRYGGGVVEMATKQGSNSFHGTAYEYLRNTVLNANVWQPPVSVLTGKVLKQKWLQNQYGVAVGGPILKNKAFIFFSWEKFASRATASVNTNVPDAGMIAAANPSVPGNITGNKANLPTAQQTLGCLDSSNYNILTNRTTIPTACLDATAQIVKNYFAPPTNATVPGATPNGNYNVLVPFGDNNQQYTVRGDVNLSKHAIFARYTHWNTDDTPEADMFNHAGFKTSGSISVYPSTQGVLGDTITINQSTIADVRLSYTRAYSNDGPPSAGTNLASLGFNSNWAAINAQQTIPLLPPFSWSGLYSFWSFRGFIVVDERWTNTYALNASITKMKGAHTFKAGGQIMLEDINGLPQFNPGTMTFNANWYAKDEWANFLLGDPVSFTFSKAIRVSPYNWYQGYYVTDTWNATRKLTVTAGLRWELPGVVAERKNRATVSLPETSATVNGINTYGILALTNSTAYAPRGVNPAKNNLLSPRLGIAYRLSNNTVLRAGYSLAYLPLEINGGMMSTGSPVNLATTGVNNTATTLTSTAANPLGGVSIIQPYGNTNPNFLASYANTTPLQSVSSPVPSNLYPYMQQWNVTAGQQFKGQQSLEAGYAGLTGIHLPASGNWNLNMLDQTNALKLAQGTITSSQAQALRPHPGYLNFTNGNTWNSTMTYNALQAKYTKRMGSGMISSSYTWSKLIGDTDTNMGFLESGSAGSGMQNYNNHRADRSVLSFNISQRWVTAYIVNLPIGKGQKWLNNLNPVVDRLIGGWAVNGITTLQVGQQVAITQQGGNNYSTPNAGAGTIRPDVTSGCVKPTSGSAQSRLGKWFETSCFQKAGAIQYGTVTDPRVNYALGTESRVDSKLRGPGTANWDFTVQKQTRITEGTNLQFRVEFFNIFNRRQFNMPTAAAGFNGSTGAINNAFGTVAGQKNNPRQIQANLRFNF